MGTLGGTLTLADTLRLQALASPGSSSAGQGVNKSVIMVYLLGGAAAVGYLRPQATSPAEYRGEFNPIPTNVDGIEICELFPKQAAMMDKLAIIRSLSTTAPNGHSDSEVMTGLSEAANPRFHHPCIGSVVSKVRGKSHDGVPAIRRPCGKLHFRPRRPCHSRPTI